MAHVEQRLRIIKRSRASSRRSPWEATSTAEEDAPVSHSPQLPSTTPPYAAYPTYNLTQLTKQEKQVLETLVNEFMGAIFFQQGVGDGNAQSA